MSAVRDASVVRYLNVQSGKDMSSDSTLSNWRVALPGDVRMQRVRGCQLLNCSFSPITQNVRDGYNHLDVEQIYDYAAREDMEFDDMIITYTDASLGAPVTFTMEVPPLEANQFLSSWAANFSDNLKADLAANGRAVTVDLDSLGTTTKPYPGFMMKWGAGVGANADIEVKVDPASTPDKKTLFNLIWAIPGLPGGVKTFIRIFDTETENPGFPSPVWAAKIIEVRYTVPPGSYTYEELAAAIQASSATRDPLVYDYDTLGLTAVIDEDTNELKLSTTPRRVGLAEPLGAPGYETFRVNTTSPLAYKLGFTDNAHGVHPEWDWNVDQLNNGMPALGGDTRCFLHIRPANETCGLVLRDAVPRNIAAWGAIDLTKTPEGHAVFQDWAMTGDSTYFNGFLDNRDFTLIDFSLRYIDGASVEVRYPGVEVSLKFFLE